MEKGDEYETRIVSKIEDFLLLRFEDIYKLPSVSHSGNNFGRKLTIVSSVHGSNWPHRACYYELPFW